MNSIASILVHLDDSPRTEERLKLARQVTQRFQASLQAIFAVESAFVALPFAMAEGSNGGAFAIQLDADRRKRMKEQFERVMAQAGPPAELTELTNEPLIPGVVHKALFADLVVLGQHEPGSHSARSLPSDFVESVIIGSGKPTLVVPYANAAATLGKRVLVAWSDTRESARALSAALPFLHSADQVDVMTWSDGAAVDPLPGTSSVLARFLEQHRVKATVHPNEPHSSGVGEDLISKACDLQSDLIVMGCYGHSRAIELVLGGATRTVLKTMTVPVLMAH
ncbi:MAG: hypothetical protein RLZZ618_1764 [Pseudomonadota bacterium]|jgi:nucleotide-binding universal stress UspA family protein